MVRAISIIFILISMNVYADQNIKNIGLTFSHIDKDYYHKVYKGKLEITVNYIVQYHGGTLKLGLFPDKKSKKLLPNVTEWEDDTELNKELVPKNGEDYVTSFVDPELIHKLWSTGKAKAGTATIIIDQYINSKMCHGSYYEVNIIDIIKVNKDPGLSKAKELTIC